MKAILKQVCSGPEPDLRQQLANANAEVSRLNHDIHNLDELLNQRTTRLVDANARLARTEGRLATLLGVCDALADRLETKAAWIGGREGGEDSRGIRKIVDVLRKGIAKAVER